MQWSVNEVVKLEMSIKAVDDVFNATHFGYKKEAEAVAHAYDVMLRQISGTNYVVVAQVVAAGYGHNDYVVYLASPFDYEVNKGYLKVEYN